MPLKNYFIFLLLLLLIGCQESDQKIVLPAVEPPIVIPPIPEPEKRPNIIVIFTDDQGFSDLGVQNILPDVKTPHIDQLAASLKLVLSPKPS